MSKKKSKKVTNEGEEKNEDHEQKEDNSKNVQKSEDGGKKESNAGNAVVLKIDLHCEGCASKFAKYIRGFEGVNSVKVDGGSGKITVTGKVDPGNLREKLEEKAHKKVELLSPVPKKDKENAKEKKDAGDGKEEKKKDSKENKPKDNKKVEKNTKEPPVTTAVLKVALHCEGCIHKIHKIVSKTKGYEEMKVDKQKDLVTVKGAMDMKELAETLKKHLKRVVEIVPPKKDEKKEKDSSKGGGGEGKNAGGEGKNAGGDGGGGGGEKAELIIMQQQIPMGYGYPSPSPYVPSPYVYGGQGYVGDPYQFHYHAPQMFSDENPNACSVM